jgi:Uma2 family endonuclease
MTALPQATKRYTPADYYALESAAQYKSDFYEGEIFDMSGGTSTHSLITANVVGELRHRLKGKPCTVYESNMRLKISATGLRTYPDVNIYCDELQYDPEDSGRTTAINPTMVFEVSSPTTEAYDRNFKAEHYRRVTSLKAYAFVAQDRPHIEVYLRQDAGKWLLSEASGMDTTIRLDAIGVDLPLAEIYDRVQFPDSVPPPLSPSGP